MKYFSTRNPSATVSLSEAIRLGLAPDGGLFVPASLPRVDLSAASSIHATALRLLEPFFAGDPLADHLEAIVRAAFDFEMPVVTLDDRVSVLELFHGPTAAFKDVGARFLAECMARIPTEDPRPATIVTATSGDTGAAVAAAYVGRPGFEVVVMYPKGRVSERQAHQLGVWGRNVRTYRVAGDFDACQRIAKQAFVDPVWRAYKHLTSANSINIGRLLPQMVYYAAIARDVPPTVVVPTGNVGNGLAAIMARAAGANIGDIVLATNDNRTVHDYFSRGDVEPRPTRATLATAMDVGRPSNLERLLQMFPSARDASSGIRCTVVDDETIRRTIQRVHTDYGRAICPHTACAFAAHDTNAKRAVIVATAHPAKFESVVEPLIGAKVAVPPTLQALLERPAHAIDMAPTLDALWEHEQPATP